MCGQLGVACSAVETLDLELETLVCLCASEEEFQLVSATSDGCTVCEDGTCGGLDGAVYLSPASEDLADLQLSVAPDGEAISVDGTVTISGQCWAADEKGRGERGQTDGKRGAFLGRRGVLFLQGCGKY